jgi:hypothetical protein
VPLNANERYPWLSEVQSTYRTYSAAHNAWFDDGFQRKGGSESRFRAAEKALQADLVEISDQVNPRKACDVLMSYRTGDENKIHDSALQHVWLAISDADKESKKKND